MPCQFCEGSIREIASWIVFYPPEAHALAKILGTLRSTTDEPRSIDGFGLVAKTDTVRACLEELQSVLTPAEQDDTIVADIDSSEPRAADIARAKPLSTLLDELSGEWIRDYLKSPKLSAAAQMIVDRHGKPHGYEMLLRGRDDKGATIMPAAFFKAACTPQLRAQLDRAARITAVNDSVAGGLDGKIFINFLPTTIYDPDFCLRSTFHAMEKAGLSPDRVVFEVVETDRIDDYAHLQRIVTAYRGEGFQIALDDFGTGYNNLESLIRLTPDYVKLDKIVVGGSPDSALKTQLITEMAAVAKMNGIVTIAEGIETEETHDHVRDLGIDLFQGYHIGYPELAVSGKHHDRSAESQLKLAV